MYRLHSKLASGGTWTTAKCWRRSWYRSEWLTLEEGIGTIKKFYHRPGPPTCRSGLNVVGFARRAGITSHLDAVPALCLGVNDVSLYELLGGYNTFVNMGIHIEPFYITRIEDKNGNVIQNFVPVRINKPSTKLRLLRWCTC